VTTLQLDSETIDLDEDFDLDFQISILPDGAQPVDGTPLGFPVAYAGVADNAPNGNIELSHW
jgi:hypothetical protein